MTSAWGSANAGNGHDRYATDENRGHTEAYVPTGTQQLTVLPATDIRTKNIFGWRFTITNTTKKLQQQQQQHNTTQSRFIRSSRSSSKPYKCIIRITSSRKFPFFASDTVKAWDMVRWCSFLASVWARSWVKGLKCGLKGSMGGVSWCAQCSGLSFQGPCCQLLCMWTPCPTWIHDPDGGFLGHSACRA